MLLRKILKKNQSEKCSNRANEIRRIDFSVKISMPSKGLQVYRRMRNIIERVPIVRFSMRINLIFSRCKCMRLIIMLRINHFSH
jgi:hypothetical protein